MKARCNVCDRGCPAYPCNCPCHGSEVVAWLDSPEGLAWSRGYHKAAEAVLWDGVFGQIKPQSCGSLDSTAGATSHRDHGKGKEMRPTEKALAPARELLEWARECTMHGPRQDAAMAQAAALIAIGELVAAVLEQMIED